MKMRHLISFICLLPGICFGQFLDPCYTSAVSSTSFISSANLADVGSNADLCVWTGTTWTGDWPGANLTLPPPVNMAGCRAIWQGNGTTWTTGGEGFGIRLSSPLVTGVAYSFPITYVSHGFGSTGSFTPRVYTNSTPTTGGGAVTLGLMPPAGPAWTTNTLSFTASAAQSGHIWLIFGTWPNLSSGFVNSFCPGCTTTPLPIELLSFEANYQEGQGVLTDWVTASEMNNHYFVLQRSNNAIDFEDLTRIEGAGNSNSILTYSYLDKYPYPGTSYYRLKQVDFNGTISYSEVRSVEFLIGQPYPNPTSGIIYLPMLPSIGENATIEIFNNLGQIILTLPYSTTIDVSKMGRGYYTLKISTPQEQSYSYKFIKE